MTIPQSSQLTLGIDATNLRAGGGLTHLIELLREAQPQLHGFKKVVVWGGRSSMNLIEARPWLDKRMPAALDKGLLSRTLWQRYSLSNAARDAGCDILFVPGGSYAGDFHPVVTMSRNMLPFETRELMRYGWSWMTCKLLLLRWTQTRSFRKCDGVIFLTKYAQENVLKVTGPLMGKTAIVPHGLNDRFSIKPKPQRSIETYDDATPYRVLYVSIIDQYKHQWNVVEAVALLRKEGLPVALDLVGPAYGPALKKLNSVIARVDPERHWVRYHGPILFSELHHKYAEADLGLFASSCENMPNILLETMAAGLPIACSDRGPMPEVLVGGGVYFDPFNPSQIAFRLHELIESPSLRKKLIDQSSHLVRQYSWGQCAFLTLKFVAEIAQSK